MLVADWLTDWDTTQLTAIVDKEAVSLTVLFFGDKYGFQPHNVHILLRLKQETRLARDGREKKKK